MDAQVPIRSNHQNVGHFNIEVDCEDHPPHRISFVLEVVQHEVVLNAPLGKGPHQLPFILDKCHDLLDMTGLLTTLNVWHSEEVWHQFCPLQCPSATQNHLWHPVLQADKLWLHHQVVWDPGAEVWVYPTPSSLPHRRRGLMVLNILKNYSNRTLVSHSQQTHPSENGHYGACRELHPLLQCAPNWQTEEGLGCSIRGLRCRRINLSSIFIKCEVSATSL